MSTQSNRDQFIKQLEKIQEGIRVNLGKLESKRAEEKSRLDTLNDTYASLIEKKRLYYKTLKDFQEVILFLSFSLKHQTLNLIY